MIKATPVAMYAEAERLRRMLYRLRQQQEELRAAIIRMETMSHWMQCGTSSGEFV